MKKFIERFSSLVKGSITGFDRIVFKGFVLPLMYAKGAMQFCGMRGILNKNYKNWMIEQSASISKAADEYGKKNCGKDVVSLPTWRIRKEELAHNQQKAEQIESGLIGIWSCLEGLLRIAPGIVKNPDTHNLEAIKPVVSICIFTLTIGITVL